jgi:ssDNA-binding Zn-finger/Zn-ribbon topoisomerase 1
MKKGLEVQCPECGKQFIGEEKMLEHLDSEHVSDKEHIKELIIEIDAKYLGGHSEHPNQKNGTLSLYSPPENKIVFKSETFTLQIPINKIKRAVTKSAVIGVEFEEADGVVQTVAFGFSKYLTEFGNELVNLRIGQDPNEKSATQELAKEAVKVRCPYCKFTYDKTLDKCPHCGAMNP